MTPRFDQLETQQQWAESLRELLRAALAAIESGKEDLRRSAKRDLRAFVDASPHEIGLHCDDLAREAIKSVTKAELANDLAQLEAIALDLTSVGKRLDRISAENEQTASALRFERAKAAVESVTGTISELTRLKNLLEQQGSTDQILDGLINSLDLLKRLRASLEELD